MESRRAIPDPSQAEAFSLHRSVRSMDPRLQGPGADLSLFTPMYVIRRAGRVWRWRTTFVEKSSAALHLTKRGRVARLDYGGEGAQVIEPG
jgi:hypothetical protein